MGGGWQVTVPQLEAWTFSRRARGRGKEEGGGCMQMGQQAVSLKWKPGQDMKRTGPGRGCTVRQGAILLARELEERDGCLSVCLCVGVFRITEKRATCADRELHRCRFLLAGVCVSQSGRSARETAPADRHVHTHTN